MKKIVILFIGVLVSISCNQEKKEKLKTTEDTTKLNEVVNNFDWLLGKWKRSNEEIGKETFENWNKKSKTEYVGFSYTTQNGDTIYQEKFKLVKSNTDWSFKIELKGETEPSSFKMTSSNTKAFVCENNEQDFPNKESDSPNKIKYWKNKDKLYATISGKEIEIQFEYVKLK
ncbi:DUF6265 family protein [Flavivirga jejuensis]|uniref:DUF6265 family protein n=1 Tax=Flavivirga jejuensis TaxID=870487 RepID=A0ABT8WTA2_9FLAO|nr:DUF6265 family protein [Flavivirga jejuensis]MDO5976077.1 DUF6265 family protein [Flavivirga jejuensis]